MSNGDIEKLFDEVVEHLSSKRDHFDAVVARRMSCEPWIHVEAFAVLQKLSQTGDVESFYPEKEYPGDRGRCDLYVRTGGTSAWIEFETIVTNYGSPGKPITQQVAHVVEDAAKLSVLPSPESQWVFCVVYPLASDGSTDNKWEQHLSRIRTEAGLALVHEWEIPLTKAWTIRAYLFAPANRPS